jgi:hypothetical protein
MELNIHLFCPPVDSKPPALPPEPANVGIPFGPFRWLEWEDVPQAALLFHVTDEDCPPATAAAIRSELHLRRDQLNEWYAAEMMKGVIP